MLQTGAFRQLLWSLAQSLVSRGLGVLVFFLVVRDIPVHIVGLISLSLAAAGMIQAVTTQTFPVLVARRYRDSTPGQLRWATRRLGMWITAASAALAILAAISYGTLSLVWMVLLGCAAPLAQCLSIAEESLLKAQLNLGAYSSRAITANLFSVLGTVALFLAGKAAIAILVQPALAAGLLSLMLRFSTDLHSETDRHAVHRFEWNEYPHFAVSAFLSSGAQRTDQFVLAGALGPATLGIYSLAFRLAYAGVDLVASAAGPFIVGQAAKQRGDSLALQHRYALVQFGTAGLLCLGYSTFTFLATTVFTFIKPALASSLVHTYALVVPYTISVGLGATSMYMLMSVTEATRNLPKIYAIRMVAGLILIPTLGHFYGLNGSIGGILCAELCQWPFRARHLALSLKSSASRILSQDLFRWAMASGAASLPLLLDPGNYWLATFTWIVAAGVVAVRGRRLLLQN